VLRPRWSCVSPRWFFGVWPSQPAHATKSQHTRKHNQKITGVQFVQRHDSVAHVLKANTYTSLCTLAQIRQAINLHITDNLAKGVEGYQRK
jgi:hypothetical protein